MNQESFEGRILKLWVTTRVPFTRANLQVATGAPRKKMEAWLKQLVIDGVLDADVNDDGEFVYSVRGAERPRAGATSVAELDKLEELGRQVRGAATAGTALALKSQAASLLAPAGAGEKSVVLSGLLSLVGGPIGWLYAGHWKEAIPGALGFWLMWKLLPTFLFMMAWPVVAVASAGVGAIYALKYNRKGERQKLLPDAEPK
jgi:hypothetical protein